MYPAKKQELEREGISTAYAILSHRWEGDENEVTFKAMSTTDIKFKKVLGWSKIEETCAKALEIGIGYAWIDTCCIDKRNLTELTEAINSMFKCCVELSSEINLRTMINEEVLAYTSSTQQSLQNLLVEIPVGRRVSWAAGREANKVEDRAYSLLGLFGVSMPLLYGEGDRAFVRLQEEIIKETNDMSLFAWCDSSATPTDGAAEFCGILATTPDHFRSCCDLRSIGHLD
ncbi:uncharacterized protein BDZ83DRAFT_724060 [Colletotrichum acutatum]|uniref:Heterokaryon incompatibility domain-containing protein n=1 Tax=Glomerella acutata TaxID=27357 RepID=A0AAD8XCH5_GLOAC|nr:uncharacterized protein BDZ83DRAFT_724060 [Colletotrichum acutatum]KAK1710325.1 hypothetical protein BDZ83DRAFT_724060 [Colletotrichum acutatum]